MSHPDLQADRPWLAEREIDASTAARLIAAQFPALAPVHLSPLGAGWDNTVFAVNQAYAFRFPRRRQALALMDTEWKLLDALAPQLPLAIPRPLFHGQPSPEFTWPFAGYTFVAGQPADVADLNHAARLAAIEPLAAFLKALHAFPAEDLGLPGDTLAKVDIVQRLPQTHSRLLAARDKGLLADLAPFEALIAALPAATPTTRPQRLVHGDLYIKHLVVDARQRLTGVIDWGDAHLGDPATDLSIVYAFLPPDARTAFWRAYGAVDDMTLTLARFRALFHNLALLHYGVDTQDQQLVKASRQSLSWLAED